MFPSPHRLQPRASHPFSRHPTNLPPPTTLPPPPDPPAPLPPPPPPHRPPLHPPQRPLRRNRIIIKHAPRTEIRHPAQRPQDIAHIVRRPDALLEDGLPPGQDALDHLDAGEVDIAERGLEAALRGVEEVEHVRRAGVGPVEVRGRAHDDDAGEVGPVAGGAAQERLERGVVLLRRGAVEAAAVGEEAGGVAEGLGEERAAEVDVAGGDVAGDDARGLAAGGVRGGGGVVGAVGLGVGAVVQRGGSREADGELPQRVVDFEDLGAVDALRVLRGGGAALRDVAGGEVRGDFARVELVLQGDLDGVAREGDGAEGGDFGVDAGDAGDEEVGFCEVEEGGEGEGGHGAGGVDFCAGG